MARVFTHLSSSESRVMLVLILLWSDMNQP
jgi:hypothetical protein